MREVLTVAASMCGQSKVALQNADAMVALLTPAWLEKSAASFDPHIAWPLEVRKRFGRWQDVLDTPDYPESCPQARTIRLGDRAVAYAALGRLPEAKAEQVKYLQAYAAVKPDLDDDGVPARQVLDVQRHLVAGEILIRDPQQTDAALDELRLGVQCEDGLRYSEPPDWIQPARHALGAALVEAGRYKEAEAVYLEDLRRWPGNGWSLYGLSRAQIGEHRLDAAASTMKRFQEAWASADVTIGNSCLCLDPPKK